MLEPDTRQEADRLFAAPTWPFFALRKLRSGRSISS